MDLHFLKKETIGLRTQETFIGNKCEIYLPEDYFKRNDINDIAYEIGERVSTIGLFWFNVDGEYYELQLPLRFEFQFSDVEKRKFRIKPELPEDTYFVYILKRGDAFVFDILHRVSPDDFGKVFFKKFIENAKIQPTTPYSETFKIFMNAMISTGVTNLGLSSCSIEMFLSEMFRNKKNLSEPFRLSYSGNDFDYKMIRITKIPELNSTFTSLIGEDIQSQLTSSILRTREGIKDRISPVEKVIKY